MRRNAALLLKVSGAGICRSGVLPVPGKTRENRTVVRVARVGLPQNDDVEPGQCLGMLAEGLPYQSFQAVPVAGLAAMFPGYRETQPGLVHAVVSGQDRKQIVATPAGFGKHMAERVWVGQAIGFRESIARLRNRF